MLDCFIINKEDVAFTHGGYAMGKYNDFIFGLRLDDETFMTLSPNFPDHIGIFVKSGGDYFCVLGEPTYYA